jgi:hypothetical protein
VPSLAQRHHRAAPKRRRRLLAAERDGAAMLLLRDLQRAGLPEVAVPVAAALIVGLDAEARAHRELGRELVA